MSKLSSEEHSALKRALLSSVKKRPMTRTVSPSPEQSGSFQERVGDWMVECFTPDIIADKLERADRFIEESLELVQATGYSSERAHALVEYVFNRPMGEPFQEVGGVRVTLSALCNPHGIDEEAAAEAELARVWTKIEKIRAKQATKPVGSALPVPDALESAQAEIARLTEALEKCRDRFAEYAEHHRIQVGYDNGDQIHQFAKSSVEKIRAADHLIKAKRIREMAEMCDAALKGNQP